METVDRNTKILSELEASVDTWMIQCLDDLNTLVGIRQSLTHTLREGWMDIARARYAMGPNRIAYPLFSLRHAVASTCVTLNSAFQPEDPGIPGDPELSDADETVNVSFKLVKAEESRNEQPRQETSEPSRSTLASELRRRVPFRASGDGSFDKPLEELILSDDSGSDDDTTVASSKGNDEQQDPLKMFGALVSPDVRLAQVSFGKAVELLVKMANTQASVLYAHRRVMKLTEMLVQSNQPNTELPPANENLL